MAILEIRDLVKRYGSGTLANDHISLTLEPGEVYGLLGPNGAGKTTLVRQLLGLLRPTSGSITVEGVDVVADPGYARRRIGFLPQSQLDLQSLHVDELIRYAARLRGMTGLEADRRTEDVIARLDLEQYRRTSLHSASGGVRRLAGFAATIVGGTRLLVLDEPTNDVDPLRRQLLWTTIAEERREGTTVLLVTHNLAEAERVIDRLAIIDSGRILREGTPASLRSLVTELAVEPLRHRSEEPEPRYAGAILARMAERVAAAQERELVSALRRAEAAGDRERAAALNADLSSVMAYRRALSDRARGAE